MTIEEFDKTGFSGQMKCRYKGNEFIILSVCFQEKLIAVNETNSFNENGDDIFDWKRCENIEIIK